MYKPLKIKSRYVVEKSKFPDDDGTHVVFYESETLGGSCYKRVFKGTFRECQEFKKERENVPKPKIESFRLFRRPRNHK